MGIRVRWVLRFLIVLSSIFSGATLADGEETILLTDRSVVSYSLDDRSILATVGLSGTVLAADYSAESGVIGILYTDRFDLLDSELNLLTSVPIADWTPSKSAGIAVSDAKADRVVIWSTNEVLLYEGQVAPVRKKASSVVGAEALADSFIVVTRKEVLRIDAQNTISVVDDAELDEPVLLISDGKPGLVGKSGFNDLGGWISQHGLSNAPNHAYLGPERFIVASNTKAVIGTKITTPPTMLGFDRSGISGQLVSTFTYGEEGAAFLWTNQVDFYLDSLNATTVNLGEIDPSAKHFIYGAVATSDKEPPSISFMYPVDGSYITSPHYAFVLVSYSDEDSGVDTASLNVRIAGSGDRLTCQTLATFAKCFNATQLLPDGAYQVNAQITDNAGNVSDLISINFVLDSTPPVAVVTDLIEYQEVDESHLLLVGAPASAEPGAVIRIYSTVTNELIAETTADAEGGFSVTVPGTVSDTYRIQAIDAAGLESPSVTYLPPTESLSVRLLWPAGNELTTYDDYKIVGRVLGELPQNWGLTINGAVAKTDFNGNFVWERPRLQPGLAQLKFVVSGLSGVLHEEIIELNVVQDFSRVNVRTKDNLSSMRAPITAFTTFWFISSENFTEYFIDWNLDGSAEEHVFRGFSNYEVGPSHEFSNRGFHFPHYQFVREDGAKFEYIAPLFVLDEGKRLAMAKALHKGLIDAILSGDDQQVAAMFLPASREKYVRAFSTMTDTERARLQTSVYKFTPMIVTENWAEFHFKELNSTRGFVIRIAAGEDGVWRISEL